MPLYHLFLLPRLDGAETSIKPATPLAEEACVNRLVEAEKADWRDLVKRVEEDFGVPWSEPSPGELARWKIHSLIEAAHPTGLRIRCHDGNGATVTVACHPDVWQFEATAEVCFVRPSVFEQLLARWQSMTAPTRPGVMETAADYSGESNPLLHLFDRALAEGVSDLHWMPELATATLSRRKQGQWQFLDRFPLNEAQRQLQQIKSCARLPLERREYPLEGQWERPSGRIRLSFVPAAHGEGLSARLFPHEDAFPDLPSLGLETAAAADLLRAFNRPSGLGLIAGATGTGKSTTAAALLKSIDPFKNRVMTLEDPVEQPIPNTRQVEVPSGEDSWHSLLRALLRQAPDYLLIGEIRDPETAAITASASLTGHRILSTLHAGSPAGVRQRLEELGLVPATQARILHFVIAQKWKQDGGMPRIQFETIVFDRPTRKAWVAPTQKLALTRPSTA